MNFRPVYIASDQAFKAFELHRYILLEDVRILVVVNDVQIFFNFVGHRDSDDGRRLRKSFEVIIWLPDLVVVSDMILYKTSNIELLWVLL
jgi:hypothetical protein